MYGHIYLILKIFTGILGFFNEISLIIKGIVRRNFLLQEIEVWIEIILLYV